MSVTPWRGDGGHSYLSAYVMHAYACTDATSTLPDPLSHGGAILATSAIAPIALFLRVIGVAYMRLCRRNIYIVGLGSLLKRSSVLSVFCLVVSGPWVALQFVDQRRESRVGRTGTSSASCLSI
jgi:hypothetical protein